MTDPLRPALGAEVHPGQNFGVIEGDPGHGAVGRLHHKLVMIYEDTRRISRQTAITSGREFIEHPNNVPGPGRIWVYWGANTGLHLNGPYLPYPPLDGIAIDSVDDPVNPLPLGRKWRDILSRFAHDVMDFNPSSSHLRDAGTHMTGHLPPTDAAAMLKNQATYQLGRAVIGVAFHRVLQWMELDAEQLALDPTNVPDAENWETWQDGTIPVAEDEIPIPNMGDMMAAICGDAVKDVAGLCVGAWVYQLNNRIASSSYNTNMNFGGEVRLPDTTRYTWYPHLFLHRVTGTGSQRSDQWDDIMGWFRDAHDYYLTTVAPAIDHTP